MPFTLDDLADVETSAIVDEKLGPLRKAEMLISKSHVRDVILPEMHDAESVSGTYHISNYRGELYFIGNLKNGTKVRAVKQRISVPIRIREIPLEQWSEFVSRKIKEKFPNEGDILGVYWFSHEALPTPFRGDVYVRPVLIDDYLSSPLFVFRRPETTERDLEIYRQLRELCLPRQSTYTETVEGSISHRNQTREILQHRKEKTPSFKDLKNKSPAKIRQYALDHDLVDERTLDKLQRYGKDCLAMLVSFNAPAKTASILHNDKRANVKDAVERFIYVSSVYREIISYFHSEFINTLEYKDFGKSAVPSHIVIDHLLNDCFETAVYLSYRHRAKNLLNKIAGKR